MKRIAICILISCLGFCSQVSGQGGIISTVAGSNWVFPANVTVALNTPLGNVYGVAVDSQGNVYVADASNNRVFRVTAAGGIQVIAGNGTLGFSGDGGQAASASLSLAIVGPLGIAREAVGLAVDAAGNLFIADLGSNRIRKVSAAGIITTVAGNGNYAFSGDGGTATSASLASPEGIAVDAAGNLFIADSANNRIRKVSTDGIITTVAGSGLGDSSGDGGPAISAQVEPTGVAVDASGNLFIADANDARIRKVSASGIITTVAGNGAYGFSGDGGAASSASLASPAGIAVDGAGNLFIADSANNRIRKVSANGTITTVTGNGNYGFSGDGGLAASALLHDPQGIAVDASGNLFISDTMNDRIRRVTAGAIITTVAGSGDYGASGDGGPATSAELDLPSAVISDGSGNLFIADTGNNRVRKVSSSGIITTVAGNGSQGFSGDGGPATSAELYSPSGIAMDGSGNLLITDSGNYRIRKVSTGGVITTAAGNGQFGFSGDGGLAVSAQLYRPQGLAVDASGNLFIADSGNNRIRKVSASGIITTVVGNGNGGNNGGFTGDGGPATSAELSYPTGVAVDGAGNFFIADQRNMRIRQVSASGAITTVAGGGVETASLGDGGPATLAFVTPEDVAIDKAGNLFIADWGNNRIRTVSASGIITTVAGSGPNFFPSIGPAVPCYCGFSGDGGPATSATLYNPAGIAVDASGNIFIADTGNNRIREVSASVPAAPSISATNDASFATSISPGSLVALFGNGNILANSTDSGFSTPLPTSSGGTSVTMNGILCPLVYVSPTQINLQAPTALTPGAATVVVNNNGQTLTTTVQVLTAAPGVFTSDYMVTAILQDGNGAVLNQSNPASPGQTVAMYLTGIGPVTNYPGDGEPAPFGPLAQSNSSYTLTVNGTAAHIDYLGLTPGLVGVGQINFEIPAGTPSGNTIPVVLTIAGTASKTVQISVK